MSSSPDGPKTKRRHIWEALADRLRQQPQEVAFVSCEGQGSANAFTLASSARGGLRREGLIVSIETSFQDSGIYVGLVRDLRRKKPS